MRPRTFLVYLSLLPLSACTKECGDYDNNEEFSKAQLPAYTEIGASTLGCRLGSQTWTVLGSHQRQGPLGPSWIPNSLIVGSSASVPVYLSVTGEMSGARDSNPFYDTQLSLVFQPTDTLGGLRLLGADTARQFTGRLVEQMQATDLLTSAQYSSRSQRPVRLLVRKLNRQQRTVSGTFEGYLYNRTDSLAVTDGRFDLRY